mgnify:CR=1 FL=1|jgi:hypothetical protein|tara:strand:- start:8496 stop:9014 length:519 start_codon:yes stop_codon:yes gene_type:complete
MQFPNIDTDIPYADYPPTFEDLQARVNAAFNSLAEIADEVEVTDDDIAVAHSIFTGTQQPTATILSSPGSVVHIKAILDEYDKVVVQSAAQLRVYVTNKLIMDSTNPDPRIRLKCYELLGKISDVGLFTDKTEVTMRHRPTEELEQLLRERLMKTLDASEFPAQPPAALTDD